MGLVALAVGLVVFASLFAMIDAALSAVSPARVTEMEREGVRGARLVFALVGDRKEFARHISILLLLRLACELGATTVVAIATIQEWGVGWLAGLVTAGTMTVVSFVLVGVGPRTIGRQRPYPVALITARPVRWLGRVLGPLSQLLIMIGNAVTPGRGFREGPFATQVELRELVDIAEQRGVVEHEERDMIHSVFSLGDTIAREVMVPRTEIVWIERTKTIRQALALALRSGFSRIPVLGESVDDIVGVVYLKDLARVANSGDPVDAPLSELMRDPEFVPESKPVDDLLREMQARRIHIGIVIDEYGGTAGLITIEDILEEIVGEITDEYDVESPPIEHLDDGTIRVSARLSVEDLEELFDISLPDDDDVETVGGLLAQALGLVPIAGATAEIAGLELTAESFGGRRNRVDTVLVRQLDRTADPEAADAQSADA
ncbi:hemolysin family protein [Fodinicola feengrottensis]|uniref:Hemolysin family protein n=1 Tax=Fodinicola feengrottensis TaxID=435914 RepID=A0ABP4UYL1_9ACTN